MTRRNNPEEAIQIAVMRHFAMRGVKDVVLFSIPNGGSRGEIERMRLAAAGVVAGVPDLCAIIEGQANFLELKTDLAPGVSGAPGVRRGSLSDRQRVMHRRLSEAGATVETAYGLDDALATLERWGVLRPQARIAA